LNIIKTTKILKNLTTDMTDHTNHTDFFLRFFAFVCGVCVVRGFFLGRWPWRYPRVCLPEIYVCVTIASVAKGNKYRYQGSRIAWTAILCLLGAFINSALSYAVLYYFRLPLFCDTIMTVAVTFCAGLVPGVITGALTNIIMHRIFFLFASSGDYLFALCSIAIALVTALFMRFFPDIALNSDVKLEGGGDRKTLVRERRIRRILDSCIALFILSIAQTLTASVAGGLIAALVTVDPAGPEMRLQYALFQSGYPAAAVEILSRIPVNMIDRPLSVFAGFGLAVLVRGVKRRYKN
jgi:hypothetical protein